MTECAHCVTAGKSGAKWHATGRMFTRRKWGKAYIVAALVCDREGCGNAWMTTGVDALEAGQAARAREGLPVYVLDGEPDPSESPEIVEREPGEDDDCPAPQPSLFRPRRSDRGFVKPTTFVRARTPEQIVRDLQWRGRDVKRDASGDTK